MVVADIVDAPGRGAAGRVGGRRVKIRVRTGGLGQDARHAFNNVVDISKIAAHAARIENFDGFAAQNGRGKQVQGHIRSAPGAVNRKKA